MDGGAGGEEEYRRLSVRLTDAAYHLETIQMRHHDVCHYYVGAQVEEAAQSFHAVVGGVDDEVLALQCLFDNHGEGSFVLNQQYVDFLHSFIIFSDKICRVLQRIMRYFETSRVLL